MDNGILGNLTELLQLKQHSQNPTMSSFKISTARNKTLKKRRVCFSQDERKYLLSLIGTFNDEQMRIFKAKTCNKIITKTKNELWDDLTEKYNLFHPNNPKSRKQLYDCYYNVTNKSKMYKDVSGDDSNPISDENELKPTSINDMSNEPHQFHAPQLSIASNTNNLTASTKNTSNINNLVNSRHGFDSTDFLSLTWLHEDGAGEYQNGIKPGLLTGDNQCVDVQSDTDNNDDISVDSNHAINNSTVGKDPLLLSKMRQKVQLQLECLKKKSKLLDLEIENRKKISSLNITALQNNIELSGMMKKYYSAKIRKQSTDS